MTMKRIYSLLAPLAAAVLLCTGCIGEDDYADTPQDNLRALWTIINEKYCFLDYKAQAIGLDWGAVYPKYASRLTADMNSSQLFEVLCDMLSELQDGHVNLYHPADMGRYWAWYEDFPTNFNEDIHREYLGTDYKIAAGLKYKILDDNIGYIYYESFSSGIGEGNLDEVMYYLRACNGLILDIRNNGGGQLTYAEKLAQRFTNEPRLVGFMAHKTGPGHNDFSRPQPEFLHPSSGIRWQKRTIVLTNRKCYSSANTFVRNVMECPLVTVLGDKTGGGSGMPFCSELPNGWLVRFSACPMYDARMQQIEFGIEPDCYVSLSEEDIKRGKDTLIESARQLLKQKP